jgi:hypothetical protein
MGNWTSIVAQDVDAGSRSQRRSDPMTHQATTAALLALAAVASVAQRLGTAAFLSERSFLRGPR